MTTLRGNALCKPKRQLCSSSASILQDNCLIATVASWHSKTITLLHTRYYTGGVAGPFLSIHIFIFQNFSLWYNWQFDFLHNSSPLNLCGQGTPIRLLQITSLFLDVTGKSFGVGLRVWSKVTFVLLYFVNRCHIYTFNAHTMMLLTYILPSLQLIKTVIQYLAS